MSQVPPPVPPQPAHSGPGYPGPSYPGPGYPGAVYPGHQPVPAQALNYAPPPSGVDLRTIAVRQRGIMLCILAYIAFGFGQFLFPVELRFIPALLAVAASVTAAVFVFMLALSLYNTATGIVLGILTLIPLVGLIVLLVINGKATNTLRRHGIRVGLLGAAASQIPAPGTGQVPIR